MKKGKFIVFEGTDGSGKATQALLLKKYLKKKGFKVKSADFPQYYFTFFGKLVGRFLKGDFGKINEVSPYLASLPYAGDRWQAKERIEKWLTAGYFVVSNRYTGSNMAHQTAKMPKTRRLKFFAWLEELEYKIYKIPKEDIVIFLHVPPEIGQGLVDSKGNRKYVGGEKRDIHEASLSHLKKAEEIYLYLARTRKHWVKVECLDRKGKLRLREDIHKEIVEVLKRRKII